VEDRRWKSGTGLVSELGWSLKGIKGVRRVEAGRLKCKAESSKFKAQDTFVFNDISINQ